MGLNAAIGTFFPFETTKEVPIWALLATPNLRFNE